ncbi:MAG: methylmalonyl-CoA mutase subunit beta [Cellulophaga sp.]
MSHTDLFSDFPEISAKGWKQKIQFDLKGADYNETLVWESPEGIKVKPFYHADDFKETPLYKSTKTNKWTIAQNIYVSDATKANNKALNAIERGANSIIFSVPSKEIVLSKLLLNIDLDTTTLYFNFNFLSTSYTKQLLAFVKNAKKNIHLNIDPIGRLARSGNWYYNLIEDFKILKEILLLTKNTAVKSTIGINLSLYQNSGATMVQQLAYTLAHANEYLNFLQNEKLIEQNISFTVSLGSNYFFEIAKLRALRLLWSSLASEYNMDPDCHIIAIPTRRNKTLYDYNVNMLRTTTECMSAIIGEADTICNLPYDKIYHKDNEFGERIARNQLLILQHESYFDKVNNPADGTYYIENVTQQLAEKALLLFKEIEKNDGFLKNLKNNTIQSKIKQAAKKEQQLFDTQQEILVGSNKYQNSEDKMKDDLELYPFIKKSSKKTLLEPIIEKRLAEKLEKERLKNE